jgi:uncharacterized SAM-binding protein YcdF (DUF218 family)
MVFFSKICTVLFLPPGCLILGLVFFTLFFRRKRGIATAGIAALLYFLSIEPVKDFLLIPLENSYPPLFLKTSAADEADALVILGNGTIQASPEAGAGMDTPAAHALKRTVYAFGFRDIFPGPFIAAGGKVFDYGQEAEAEVMGRVLISLGLPARRVLKESGSRNTWQNAKNVSRLFGYKKIILVTSAYHMRRSVFCFENNGLEVIPAPTDYLCARNSSYSVFSFLPSADAFSGTCTALHEYLGLLYYRLAYP